jgi:hypothetical protein
MKETNWRKKMITKGKTYSRTVVLATILMVSFALVGCIADVATPLPTDAPPEETPVATIAPTDVPTEETGLVVRLNTEGLASGYREEWVGEVSDTANHPYWEVLPEHLRITLENYLIGDHLFAPQIFVYPVEELVAINEGAAQNVASLQSLLQSPQEITPMPLLPLFNAGQMLQVQVQYLDFQPGQGVRYLTMLSQGLNPINNYELIYTYQGLTNDGRYYVAVILPVHHADLPPDSSVTSIEPATYTDDYPAYLENIINMLNPQPADSFSPNLTALDAMISSLEIK